jgi:hypothetical protein
MSNKLTEILQELQAVVMGENSLIDTIIPPILFLVLTNAWGFTYAIWGSLVLAIAILGWRVVRKQKVWSAVGGVVGVLLALGLTRLLGREDVFFLPSILIGIVTIILAVGSNFAGKPMVAWTSYLTRRWPWDWYWHPQVRPAYTEITWLWAVFFLLRVVLQINALQAEAANQLAGLNLLLGWPAILLLLIVTYLYGTWRLRNLGGPSVDEFVNGVEPPWESQQRGF